MKIKIFDLSTFKFYYSHLGYKLIIQIVLSILISLLDSLGLSMFFPLLEMVSGNNENVEKQSFIIEILQDFFKYINVDLTLINVLLLLSFFFILKGIVQYGYTIFYTNVRQAFIRDLRLKLINNINHYSYKSFVTTDVGRVQNSLTGEIERIAVGYINYFSTMQNFIFVVVYTICVFFIDFEFALLVMVGGLVTNLLFSRIYKFTKRASQDLTKKNHSFQGLIIQYIGNYKYLKATGSLNKYSQILTSNIYKLEKNSKMIGRLGGIVSAVREPILILLISFVIVIQISVLGGSITSVLISLMFFYRALGYLMTMQNAYNNYLGASGSLNNIYNFIDDLTVNKEEFTNVEEVETIKNGITIRNAVFSYNEHTPIINNVSLSIEKNQSIAFVGESGSGKTTLANIIAGLFKLNSGEILIDGKNISNLKIGEYRQKIGYITQESVIFNDSIFNNVTFWEEKNPETIARFNDALHKASIFKFIEELPEKEETLLGNNGINLSGGQRQRISIARELYKNAEILILDEATSALDSETEGEVQASIDLIKGKYTLIIIAHRLSTIKNVDKIVLMNKGEILESGTFEELINNSPKFKAMVDHQDFNT